jgi:hypothetical protein
VAQGQAKVRFPAGVHSLPHASNVATHTATTLKHPHTHTPTLPPCFCLQAPPGEALGLPLFVLLGQQLGYALYATRTEVLALVQDLHRRVHTTLLGVSGGMRRGGVLGQVVVGQVLSCVVSG